MCHSAVIAVIVLVGDTMRRAAAAGADTTISDAWTTMMTSAEPGSSSEIAKDHVIMQILTEPVVQQSARNGDTTEELQGNAYNGFYSSTVNFNDIYSNNVVVLGEDPTKDEKENDAFHLKNLPANYVEFRPQTEAGAPVTLPTAIYILNASYVMQSDRTVTSSTSKTTADEPEEISVRVIPIKKDYQRGILDLLFPAARVRTFKTVFDTFRRLMSHTFR